MELNLVAVSRYDTNCAITLSIYIYPKKGTETIKMIQLWFSPSCAPWGGAGCVCAYFLICLHSWFFFLSISFGNCFKNTCKAWWTQLLYARSVIKITVGLYYTFFLSVCVYVVHISFGCASCTPDGTLNPMNNTHLNENMIIKLLVFFSLSLYDYCFLLCCCRSFATNNGCFCIFQMKIALRNYFMYSKSE